MHPHNTQLHSAPTSCVGSASTLVSTHVTTAHDAAASRREFVLKLRAVMNGTSYRLAAASRAVLTCAHLASTHVRTARDAAASRREVPFITARSFNYR